MQCAAAALDATSPHTLSLIATSMYRHQNRWYSRCLSMASHVEGISDAAQVLTVRRGSQ